MEIASSTDPFWNEDSDAEQRQMEAGFIVILDFQYLFDKATNTNRLYTFPKVPGREKTKGTENHSWQKKLRTKLH